jgi:putative endonuclease
MAWFVYIVRCKDRSLYTGITTDVNRRVKEHNTSKRGARYTRSRRPVKLVWKSLATDRQTAMLAERAFKGLPKRIKEACVKRLSYEEPRLDQ